MKTRSLTAVLCLVVILLGGPLAAEPQPTPQPIKLKDLLAWKSLSAAVLSRDGRWFAYRVSPNEGDSEVVVRATQGEQEWRFPCGQVRGFGGGGLAFAHNSRWLAFAVHPTAKEAKQLERQRKPAHNKAALVNLATGQKQEFERVKRFAYSGVSSRCLALHKYPADSRPGADQPVNRPAERRTERPAESPPEASPDKWTGSDLILYDLAGGDELNTGNVAEFAFDKEGRWLALTIDAQGQDGNGVQLRNLATAAVVPLDSGKAAYQGLTWTEKGDGLVVLKGVRDKAYRDRLYSVLGFTELMAARPRKTVYDPHKDKAFPAGMTISPHRPPQWTEDLAGILFGIHELKKKEDAAAADKGKEIVQKKADGPPADGEARQPRPAAGPRRSGDDPDRPDLVIWHWGDDRLQSEQQVMAGSDRNFSYLCLYRPGDRKFLRLADDSLRDVQPAPHQRWAVGFDRRAYELSRTLDGRRYQDVYVLDLATGARKVALKKNRWYFGASPEGTHFLYYDDGHFYTYELATGKVCNITRGVAACFVNDEDDHPVIKPPRPPLGWVKGGGAVLLSDGWDVWSVPAQGGKGINLTPDGKKEGVRYQRRFVLDPEEKGIDLSGPVYFSVYGEWTKKGGIARIDGGQPGAERLLWDDAAYTALVKAKDADVYLFTRQTEKDFPDYHVADRSLHDARRLTRMNPQQSKFLWSKGTILVDYTSAKGAKLQGTLFLPAQYEENKRYPTIVYIYEKLSWHMHHYPSPTANGFNTALYTSNGYAVFMPDIVYQVNDPGRSAVWCVLPALEAAIATGVVDRDRVGLHGHSWGGYQTSFLITQTDAFRAAVAGAPLTNLISMYSSIYWNTGWANQPIFESSQGRFTGGYWDNPEAYVRNSPVYHAKNVKTPLLLLHNDKDGAVDWNQGIEYFNTLRRLRKPVVLLQYKGENHGLRKPANQKDYTVRMLEFFDHHLRGKPAPDWLEKGIPHLRQEDHLKERARAGGW